MPTKHLAEAVQFDDAEWLRVAALGAEIEKRGVSYWIGFESQVGVVLALIDGKWISEMG